MPVRILVVFLLALAVAAAAGADPSRMKPDRPAIGALLDEFIPDVVERKDLKAGWELAAGAARAGTSRREWLRGDNSIQRFPAKGSRFHGFVVNYAYPGDVGFDILLQPTTLSLGARSFRAEAQKLGGHWRITTWYPIASFAPVGKVATVLGPNDLGPANGSATAGGSQRLGAWALAVPILLLGGIAAGSIAFGGARWLRVRARVRELERQLGRTR